MESTKADEIAYALEEAIVSGEIEPGSILRQESLSERTRSRGLRSARRFAASRRLGSSSSCRTAGVRVRTLSREELREAFLVRAELESLATALAVPRFDEEGLAELEAAEQRFAELTAELRKLAREGGRTQSGDRRRVGAREPRVPRRRSTRAPTRRTSSGWRRAPAGRSSARRPGRSARSSTSSTSRTSASTRRSAPRSRPAASTGPGPLARDHVLHSGHLLEVILDQVERTPRPTRRLTPSSVT